MQQATPQGRPTPRLNDDPWRLTATDQARLVAQGDISAVELLERHLDRIAAVNPTVNAIGVVLAESARQAAAKIDQQRARGETLGPLAGVPVTVKANIHVAGTATTHGIPAFREMVAATDSPPVRRLRRAGAVPIGRSNMADLAMGFHTTSRLYGDTRNPWRPDLTPGGTSGGDGAAVATGMAPLGLGNDSGGSVRIPAAFCGVAGLKPGYGRFPADHRIAGREPTLASQLFPVDGPLARSVADLRLVYGILAGADPVDPRVPPVPPFGPPLPAPVRIGVVADPGGQGVHPEVRTAVESAAAALGDAGYLVEEIALPDLTESLETYARMIMSEFSLGYEAIRPLLSEAGQHWIDQSMAAQSQFTLSDYVQTTATRLRLQREWAELMERYPLLLGPVFTEPPVPVELATATAEGAAAVQRAMRLATATTFIGLPAVAVPAGLAGGLPMSVQVIGQPYREDLCLDAAAAIESRLGPLTPIDPRL